MSDEEDLLVNGEDQGGEPARTLAELRTAVARAAASYDWETAIPLVTRALSLPDVPPDVAYELLDTRAIGYRYAGMFSAGLADQEQMAALAREMGDVGRQVRAMYGQVEELAHLGDRAAALELAESALSLAMQFGDAQAEATSLYAIAYVRFQLGDAREVQTYGGRALHLYEDVGDECGQALCLRGLSSVATRTGQPAQGQTAAQRALELCRRVGDREGEAQSLAVLGMAVGDRAQARVYYEQALAIAEATGNQVQQATLVNNLSLIYQHTGLYGRAIDYAERAVTMAHQTQARGNLAYFLDTLARAYLRLGLLERAEQVFVEGRATAQEVGDRGVEPSYTLGLGWVALAAGRPTEAVQHFEAAAEAWTELGATSEVGVALAWKGAAHLALGEVAAAQEATARAAALAEAGSVTSEYDSQDVWWWRYRALTAPHHPSPQAPLAGEGAGDGGDAAWYALDRARADVVAAVATLSDDGLRRSYFSKVAVNRAIIEEWLLQAARRGLDLAPFTDHLSGTSSAQEQLKRILDIGVRLNQRREAAELPGLVLDEVVELTGAERAALLLVDDTGGRRVAAASVTGKTVGAEDLGADSRTLAWLGAAASTLDEAAGRRVPILSHLPVDAPELEQNSVLCVPLEAQGRLVGLVYAELGGHFGRFGAQDCDMLTVLANQAAVALVNAEWANTLERRVEERTAELETINDIGQGLARQLDTQAIVELVGERIGEVIVADATDIHLYDRQAGLVHCVYSVEQGTRTETEPFALGPGLTSVIIRSGKPLLLGTWADQMAAGGRPIYAHPDIPDEAYTESYLGVPILAGSEVIGQVAVHSYQPHAYDESDVRLLNTIAANMSVALENARLFDETNRLLEETRQRNAELALINAIQQGLAAQLDALAIIDLVGDKLREIFGGQNTMIALYHRATNMVNVPYWVGDNGQRIRPEPLELGTGLTSRVIESRQPLVLGTAAEGVDLGAVIEDDGTPEMPESWLGVPIIVGSEVTGAISLQDWPKNRYSDSDVRLLSTLASSMAVALENARLFAETNRLLEETRQRNAELALINTVQQGLAAQLDVQAIYDLVGDKLREIFGGQATFIALYDEASRTISFPYYVGDQGERIAAQPLELGQGLSSIVITSRRSLVLGKYEDAVAYGAVFQDDDRMESWMGAPILIGDTVIGLIAVQDYPANRYAESDVRLLSTLASSMAVALENARLFGETNRLLDETRQRAAELEIISSVGRALAAQLDMQAIYDVV
ncbi:MAG: GAF domain-containing protein, partial [Anaerolineales bacterium]|nr:GAF domain-containing protein [Anaerolineales bacterium]